jgi:thiamine biosynthesis lipoprotein ApbE
MKNQLTRRSLFKFSLAAVAPGLASVQPFRFQHDHVMGTSFDLIVNASSEQAARAAHAAARDEIERLCKILSTYDAESEISRNGGRAPSHDLRQVLAAYDQWSRRTSGAISVRAPGTLNVDALGKAYVIDHAATAALAAGGRHIDGLLLNIGGDIVVRGNWPVGVADPAARADNAAPIAQLELRDAAVATSGVSQRGRHIIDPRTGRPAEGAASGTVVAADCVTANALATALCVMSPPEGMRLVEQTPGADCLMIARDGGQLRSSGFAAHERPRVARAVGIAAWQKGYEVSVVLALKEILGFRVHRPYVAIWAEDLSGKLVRNISVWAQKPRYLPDLRTWWSRNGGSREVESMTQPTRPPGRYRVVWDGLDDQGQPVPPGTYRITVETNREHGDYAKVNGPIECDAKPAKITFKATGEFEDIIVEYGPRSQNA